jgi:hypothetical protein
MSRSIFSLVVVLILHACSKSSTERRHIVVNQKFDNENFALFIPETLYDSVESKFWRYERGIVHSFKSRNYVKDKSSLFISYSKDSIDLNASRTMSNKIAFEIHKIEMKFPQCEITSIDTSISGVGIFKMLCIFEPKDTFDVTKAYFFSEKKKKWYEFYLESLHGSKMDSIEYMIESAIVIE